jgi:hypothetical protein
MATYIEFSFFLFFFVWFDVRFFFAVFNRTQIVFLFLRFFSFNLVAVVFIHRSCEPPMCSSGVENRFRSISGAIGRSLYW